MEYKTPFHRLIGIQIQMHEDGASFTEYEIDPDNINARRWKLITTYGESLNFSTREEGMFVHKLFSQAYHQGIRDNQNQLRIVMGLECAR